MIHPFSYAWRFSVIFCFTTFVLRTLKKKASRSTEAFLWRYQNPCWKSQRNWRDCKCYLSLSMSVISSLLNYNLKKKHWNPVRKRGTKRSSPPQPGLLKKWNADQSTIPLTFCSEHWQIQETQGISQCPLSNQYDRHQLFTLTRASYHSQTFFYFPFTYILKRNCWTCLMSDSLSRLATLVTRLGQLNRYRYPCPFNNPLYKQMWR